MNGGNKTQEDFLREFPKISMAEMCTGGNQ